MRPSAPFETITRGSALWAGGAFGPENSWINLVVMTAICVALRRVALSPGGAGRTAFGEEAAAAAK